MIIIVIEIIEIDYTNVPLPADPLDLDFTGAIDLDFTGVAA